MSEHRLFSPAMARQPAALHQSGRFGKALKGWDAYLLRAPNQHRICPPTGRTSIPSLLFASLLEHYRVAQRHQCLERHRHITRFQGMRPRQVATLRCCRSVSVAVSTRTLIGRFTERPELEATRKKIEETNEKPLQVSCVVDFRLSAVCSTNSDMLTTVMMFAES